MFFKNLHCLCSVRLSVRSLAFQAGKTGSIPVPSTIVKCYQGIVIGRYDYSTVRVRPTLSDITAIRL